MTFNAKFVELFQLVPWADTPIAAIQSAGATAVGGERINLRSARRAAFVLIKNAGTAGEDPVITVQQATAASGGTVKALKFDRIYRKQATGSAALSAIGLFTETEISPAANTFTDTDSAERAAVWIVDVSAEDLDEDCEYVTATVAATGTNAQLGTGFWIPYGLLYNPPPSVID